jgi:serine protease Do
MMKQISQSKFRLYLSVILTLLVMVTAGFSNRIFAAVDPMGSSVVADIAEKCSAKVVWITTTYPAQESMATPPQFKQFFAPFGDNEQDPTPPSGLGSGFFYDEKGYILTNAHVVAGAKTIEVTLQNQKTPLTAKLIGFDQVMDIAVIKVDLPDKVPYLTLGNSDKARVGDWVVAIGNPYGLDHTVTAGIISAKGRPLVAAKGSGNYQSYENMIQTDAAINPGNSGGPLLNLNGEVIGINTAVSATGQGLGFAIPINPVQEVLQELMTKGKITQAWLGVNLIDIRAVDAKTRAYLNLNKVEGVLIKPLKDSPAAKADLRNYDLVTEINHKAISNPDDLVKIIRKLKVGDKVNLLILRNGNPMVVEVVLGEKPQ